MIVVSLLSQVQRLLANERPCYVADLGGSRQTLNSLRYIWQPRQHELLIKRPPVERIYHRARSHKLQRFNTCKQNKLYAISCPVHLLC
jgi:hypothetical protein